MSDQDQPEHRDGTKYVLEEMDALLRALGNMVEAMGVRVANEPDPAVRSLRRVAQVGTLSGFANWCVKESRGQDGSHLLPMIVMATMQRIEGAMMEADAADEDDDAH